MLFSQSFGSIKYMRKNKVTKSIFLLVVLVSLIGCKSTEIVIPEDLSASQLIQRGQDAAANNKFEEADKYYVATNYGHKISGGFWSEAENMEILLDAYQMTGDLSYKTKFDEVYRHFYATQYEWNQSSWNTGNWLSNGYNDDIMWISIALVRAYLMWGGDAYLDRAKFHFDAVYDRGLTDLGLMVWSHAGECGPYNIKTTAGSNSCICGPTEVCACYLAMATGDNNYYEIAKNLYAKQRQYLYNPDNGHVYDSYSRYPEVSYNYWASTYNQGTFLGAAVMLYNHYGDVV